MLHNSSDLNHPSQQPSMEDILSSIRSIVSGNKKPGEWAQKEASLDEEDVLDLRHPLENIPENHRSVQDSYLSPQAQDALMTALDPLKKINKSSPSKDADTIISQKSLEDIVRKALKPLLKDWLDLNLPQLVQTIVREEIAKVLSKN